MPERDANQLAADAVQRLRSLIPAEGFHYAWCNARPCTCEAQYDREALDEVVALVGTLQQERDERIPGAMWQAERDRAVAAEAALAEARQALTALLDDTLVLMDQHASEEVKLEARRRIIERHGAVS